MKKIIIALLAVVILLNLNSCAVDDVEYSYNSIKDALKISTWVLDNSLDENGYWVEDEQYTTRSYWIESNGRVVDSNEDDIFVFEQLKLNEARTMAPLAYCDPKTGIRMFNLNIFFEFDGMIEVVPNDEYMRLVYDANNPAEPWKGEPVSGNIKVPYAVCANVCPLDEYPSDRHTIRSDIKKADREYYLNVNAYKFGNEESPIIRARLKLSVLEDKAILPNHDSFGVYVGEEMSRFLAIELVSYEYSDVYRILDEIVDEEDDE